MYSFKIHVHELCCYIKECVHNRRNLGWRVFDILITMLTKMGITVLVVKSLIFR